MSRIVGTRERSCVVADNRQSKVVRHVSKAGLLEEEKIYKAGGKNA